MSSITSLYPMSEDAIFFRTYRQRFFRIRAPLPDEFNYEEHFGMHQIDREAIIAVRMPQGVMRIPFLKFADEEIADNDSTLKPIVDEMMTEARDKYRKMT